MSIFRILQNTPLKFTRLEDWNVLQTENNRQQQDYNFYGKIGYDFIQEFDYTDNLFYQYRTDYENVTISLVNNSGQTTLLPSLVKVYTNDQSPLFGEKQYNVDIDLSNLEGRYYIKIDAVDYAKPVLTFTSQKFIVTDSKLLKLEWFGSTIINDPFVWTKNISLRIEGEIKKRVAQFDRDTYLDTDGNYEQTYGLPQNGRLLQIRKVPEFMQAILDLAIFHEQFYVNGILFGYEKGWEYEATEGINYSATLTVFEKDYYNFTIDEELTGNAPVFEEELRTSGIATRTTGVEDRKINN